MTTIAKVQEYLNHSLKLAYTLKSKIWDNKTNKITLLFILAAILVAAFTYHQFARRHYELTAHSQRSHNQQLKKSLQELRSLNATLNFLENIDGKSVLDDSFPRKVKELGIDKIKHESELLVNCSKQYNIDSHQASQTEKFIDRKIKQLQDLGVKG